MSNILESFHVTISCDVFWWWPTKSRPVQLENLTQKKSKIKNNTVKIRYFEPCNRTLLSDAAKKSLKWIKTKWNALKHNSNFFHEEILSWKYKWNQLQVWINAKNVWNVFSRPLLLYERMMNVFFSFAKLWISFDSCLFLRISQHFNVSRSPSGIFHKLVSTMKKQSKQLIFAIAKIFGKEIPLVKLKKAKLCFTSLNGSQKYSQIVILCFQITEDNEQVTRFLEKTEITLQKKRTTKSYVLFVHFIALDTHLTKLIWSRTF